MVTCECGARWGGRKPEHCTACHHTFSGTKSGDWHRVGRHGVRTGPDRRRCLTDIEMIEHPHLTARMNDYGTTVWGHPGNRPFPGA